jgi:uncharacterized membrane protein YoaK (UPF0700 family)
MKDYTQREIGLAASLSAVAGFVDAVGYLKLGGFFVSFMSGNTTRLGVALGGGLPGQAAKAAGLIGLFVAGVVLGAVVVRAGAGRRGVVLAAEAALLVAAATAFSLGLDAAGALGLVLAMGVENAVFQRDGEVAVGLTYMTGALVKVGQRLAAALAGGPRWTFAPYLLLWASLCSGAVLGAACYGRLGGAAVWIAALALAGLAAGVLALERKA